MARRFWIPRVTISEEGSIGLQDIVDAGLVSPIYTVFRFAPDRIDNRYAYSVLKTSLYRHIFDVSTSASVDRRGSLRWTEFSSIPFPVPPLEEQSAIVEVISKHATKLARLSRAEETSGTAEARLDAKTSDRTMEGKGMKFIYVDESGGRDQGDVFTMCGLMVDAYKLRKKTKILTQSWRPSLQEIPECATISRPADSSTVREAGATSMRRSGRPC